MGKNSLVDGEFNLIGEQWSCDNQVIKKTSIQSWGHFCAGTKFKAVSHGAERQSIKTDNVTGDYG